MFIALISPRRLYEFVFCAYETKLPNLESSIQSGKRVDSQMTIQKCFVTHIFEQD